LLAGVFAGLVLNSRSRRHAVGAIERGGGKVGHDWFLDRYNRPINQQHSAGFRWLESWDGTGVFKSVRLVILDKGSGSDSNLIDIGRLG
jgi:hypothetical protein